MREKNEKGGKKTKKEPGEEKTLLPEWTPKDRELPKIRKTMNREEKKEEDEKNHSPLSERRPQL